MNPIYYYLLSSCEIPAANAVVSVDRWNASHHSAADRPKHCTRRTHTQTHRQTDRRDGRADSQQHGQTDGEGRRRWQ